MSSEPVAQPLCADCIHFDGGTCPLLRTVLDLHGQTPIRECTRREEMADEPTTSAAESAEESA